MIVQHQNRWRSFFATLCLVAVVLLYAPLGGAAWLLYSSACCTSGAQKCPIHGHHHAQTPANGEHAMDCGHDMVSMAQCSMSCCHNPDRPSVASAIFVLPAPVTVSLVANIGPLIALTGPQNSFNSFEPLSPPPRLSPQAA